MRWLGTFADILFFEHQNDIFNVILRMTQVNVWSKHIARWLANIWFSCSRMLVFVMTCWKNLQLLGALPPGHYQGLCPWSPMGAYCGPQTPASFSSFFTFPQSHFCDLVQLRLFCPALGSADCGWRLVSDMSICCCFASSLIPDVQGKLTLLKGPLCVCMLSLSGILNTLTFVS